MNRSTLALLLAAPLALAACGGADEPGPVQQVVDPVPTTDAAPDAPGMGAEAASGPVVAEVVEGVQTAEVEAGRMGYQPRQIQLRAGVPARLVFTRTVEDDCSSQITVPAYDVGPTDLPLGEPVAVEFTPTEAGEVEFVCGMDMQRGTIAVVS